MVCAALAALTMMRRRLAPALLSPVWLVTIGLIAVATFGSVFYDDVQSASGGGSAIVVLDRDQTLATFNLMMACVWSLLAGAGLVSSLSARLPLVNAPDLRSVAARRRGIFLFTSMIPLGMLLWGEGAAMLWRRQEYIAVAVGASGWRGLAGQLAIGAVLGLGYLAGAGRQGSRYVAIVGAASYLVVFFGAGSRRLAMWPILFMLGWYLATRTRRAVLALVLAAGASLYLIKLPLYLRGLASHGIDPYWHYLPGFPEFSASWGAVFRNILISFGIIGATAYQQPPISQDVLGISLNPLPGSMVGWYDVAPALRINPYTPFAGIGELGNHGLFTACGYFVVVGAMLSLFDRKVVRLINGGRPVLALVLIGLSALFVLYSVQYNLRTSTRMLLYAVIVSLLLGLLLRRQPRSSGSDATVTSNDIEVAEGQGPTHSTQRQERHPCRAIQPPPPRP
jgi:hypothetical protein